MQVLITGISSKETAREIYILVGRRNGPHPFGFEAKEDSSETLSQLEKKYPFQCEHCGHILTKKVHKCLVSGKEISIPLLTFL